VPLLDRRLGGSEPLPTTFGTVHLAGGFTWVAAAIEKVCATAGAAL
jgi:hypothetical protein